MALSAALSARCGGTCEICNNESAVHEFAVTPRDPDQLLNQTALCDTCLQLMDQVDADHWRCLEGSIWNPEPAVQALSYRLLYARKDKEWAADILNAVEADEDIIQWALTAFQVADVHKDAFNNTLENGDNVVLTQALNVKGASFTAAKGTIVKKIRLVPDNTGQIEGKINDQTIVILTKFVKKG
jgi:protein PhnA